MAEGPIVEIVVLPYERWMSADGAIHLVESRRSLCDGDATFFQRLTSPQPELDYCPKCVRSCVERLKENPGLARARYGGALVASKKSEPPPEPRLPENPDQAGLFGLK
jgi:hypothetical protein